MHHPLDNFIHTCSSTVPAQRHIGKQGYGARGIGLFEEKKKRLWTFAITIQRQETLARWLICNAIVVRQSVSKGQDPAVSKFSDGDFHRTNLPRQITIISKDRKR